MRLVKSDVPEDRPAKALPEFRLQVTFADGFSAIVPPKNCLFSFTLGNDEPSAP